MLNDGKALLKIPNQNDTSQIYTPCWLMCSQARASGTGHDLPVVIVPRLMIVSESEHGHIHTDLL